MGVSWEVEIVTKDGRQLEVLVNARFGVVAEEEDTEDSDGPDDD